MTFVFIQAILASALLLDATGDITADSLKLTLEVYPRHEIMPDDPIFFRITAKNVGAKTVFVPRGAILAAPLLRLFFSNPKTGASWWYPTETAFLAFGPSPLKPGETRVLYRVAGETITLPASNGRGSFPLGDADAVRMHVKPEIYAIPVENQLDPVPNEANMARAHRLRDYVGKHKPYPEVDVPGPELRVKRRPPAEAALVDQAKPFRASAANSGPDPRSVGALVPVEFDNRDGRKEFEGKLSPGTLRDVVHLYRLIRAIYEEKDEAKGRACVEELLAWLDTLPEIERDSFVLRASDQCFGASPAKPVVYFDLARRLADRSPEDTQWSRERCLRSAAGRYGYGKPFVAYLKAKGEKFPWIDEYLNPKPPATAQPGRKN
jgi:hypothetical protein